MKIVTEEYIEQAIELVEKMADEEFTAFADEFAKQQPALAAYIFMQQEFFSDDDFDLIANMALTIYKAYEITCGKAMTLTEKEVADAANKQLDYLQAIENATEEEMPEFVEKAFDSSEQPLLLDFAAHELHLMESQGAIDHESGGALIYPVLLLVIDLLHIAFNGSRLKII
jgi:hypothetical protein